MNAKSHISRLHNGKPYILSDRGGDAHAQVFALQYAAAIRSLAEKNNG